MRRTWVEVDRGEGLGRDVVGGRVERLELVDDERARVKVAHAALLARVDQRQLRTILRDRQQLL